MLLAHAWAAWAAAETLPQEPATQLHVTNDADDVMPTTQACASPTMSSFCA